MTAVTGRPPISSMFQLLGTVHPIKIIDVGASPVDGDPVYRPLLESNAAHILGFDPNPVAIQNLNETKGPHDLYLPYVIADGKPCTIYETYVPAMSSLLKPNLEVMRLFHRMEEFSRVVGEHPFDTHRLDDVPQARGFDFMKIDVQGAELMVFENAIECLKSITVVHSEVEFLPLYENQPLYMDIAAFLRDQGFSLLKFDDVHRRTYLPVNVYTGLNQQLWGDGIFVRDLTRLDILSADQLLRMAIILHECYRAYDVVLHIFAEYDRKTGYSYYPQYTEHVNAASAQIAYYQPEPRR